jgi:hypothetical protein
VDAGVYAGSGILTFSVRFGGMIGEIGIADSSGQAPYERRYHRLSASLGISYRMGLVRRNQKKNDGQQLQTGEGEQ